MLQARQILLATWQLCSGLYDKAIGFMILADPPTLLAQSKKTLSGLNLSCLDLSNNRDSSNSWVGGNFFQMLVCRNWKPCNLVIILFSFILGSCARVVLHVLLHIREVERLFEQVRQNWDCCCILASYIKHGLAHGYKTSKPSWEHFSLPLLYEHRLLPAVSSGNSTKICVKLL